MSESFDDGRLDQVVDFIVQLASGDLSARLEPSEARDSLDAVITGINLLAGELELTMEERVAERTVVLEQARIALERMALYDSLTGLANRTLLGDRIHQAIAWMERGARPPCVLVLDLDEFKTINDGLGHSAGDRILTDVAQRLTS
ncbi:MAG: GGDEF domain-containing protein, partial [Nakamurella sp.]